MAEDREMAPESLLEASHTPNSLQWQQHRHENGVEVDEAEEEHVDEGLQLQPDDDNGPTHHPYAPPDEIFDITTTIDPRYIISLIRKLLPVDERQGDDLQGLAEWSSSNQRPDNDQRANGASSPKIDSGTDDNDTEPREKTAREKAWEESGCVLWDLAASKEHAEFMVQNFVLEVLLANLVTSDSVRITEIDLGIIGNLACHEALMDQITSNNKLLETIVDQVFSDDAPCLCEVCRLLTLGLQGCQRVVWARALQSDHILSRILWIVENTLNPVLIEKSVGLFLAIMENQEEVAPILLPTLMNLGLPDLLVNLLSFEMGKLTSDRIPERYPALDSILRAVEVLSVTDDYSERICSNKEVVQMAIELIKIPEKTEISSSCVTSAVLLANILTDAPDLAFKLSEDFLLLQSLLDLFPFTSDDFEARNALWSVVARLLARVQEAEMRPSRLNQFVLMFVDKSDMIEDTLLESKQDESSNCDAHTISEAKFDSRTVAIKCIVKILVHWNRVKDEESVAYDDADNLEKSCPDERDVQKLLDCCLKHAS
ncbi:uncharacterized protein LOC110731813 [Chenopodium quinoa]|uniref:uncharacterized protein LOC110731813 n=1 Tax=Chenopodium quinoa TaxID=63459 RepID=UPI000B76E493|nr:uncharacterized protein LOC110731813 [Chenopodium quinoa]